MSVMESPSQTAKVRWLVAGALSSHPEGRRFSLETSTFPETVAQALGPVDLALPDTLGTQGTRRFTLSFLKLRDFQLGEVVAAVPVLKDLRALADALGSAQRPSPEQVLSHVLSAVGPGSLHQSLQSALAPTPVANENAPPPPPTTLLQGADRVELLFAQTDAVLPTPQAKAGVDAFLRAVGTPSAAKPGAAAQPGHRVARTLLESTVYETARALLLHPDVARLEAAWRGLKLLLERCPASSGMAIELLDVTPAQLLSKLEQALPDEPFERPDALLLVDALGDVTQLKALADLAEKAQVPALVALAPALFSGKIEEEGVTLTEPWLEFRKEETSRWLCGVVNRVVLHTEGTGALRRSCLGSPVFGLGALLAASYRETGSFARIFAKAGGLKCAGSHELAEGKDAGMLVPTEVFLPIRAQTQLAQLGVLGLGSPRNSDVLTLASAPTAKGGEDVLPLPAQILAGRIVRFSQWVREQLQPAASQEDIALLFQQAAELFLFSGAPDAGKVSAELMQSPEEGRSILIRAAVRQDLAGLPFSMGFVLPLRH